MSVVLCPNFRRHVLILDFNIFKKYKNCIVSEEVRKMKDILEKIGNGFGIEEAVKEGMNRWKRRKLELTEEDIENDAKEMKEVVKLWRLERLLKEIVDKIPKT